MISHTVQSKREKTLNTFLEISRKIGFITLIVSVISSLSFLISYSFLFGYYFGGEVENSFSNFELIRTFIPFDLNTILFTNLLLGLSITLIMYSVQIFLKNEFFAKVGILILIIVFHIILTAFFTDELTTNNILKFSVIWIFPLVSTVLILFFIRGVQNTFKISSGSLFGFLISVLIIALFEESISEFTEGLILLLIFLFGIVFTFLPFKRIWNVLFLFPFIYLTTILLSVLVDFSFYKSLPILTEASIMGIISLLVSWWLSNVFNRFFINKEGRETDEIKSSINNIILEITDEFMNPKTHKKAAVFLIIFLLISYVFLPRLSTSTAKIIRENTPDRELQFYSLEVLSFEGSLRKVKGIPVAEKENILYISNESWELEQIKTEQYYIKK